MRPTIFMVLQNYVALFRVVSTLFLDRVSSQSEVAIELGSFIEQWVKTHVVVPRLHDPVDRPFSGMTFVLVGRMSRPQVRFTLDLHIVDSDTGEMN